MGTRIERFGDAGRPLPALPALGQSRQRRSRPALLEHRHDHYECCLVTGGVVHWQVEGRSAAIGPDGCFLTKPGERHGSVRRVLEPCVLTWLQVDPRHLGVRELVRRLRRAPHHADHGASRLVPVVEAMLRECRTPRADSPILLRGLLDQFLVGFLRTMEAVEDHPHAVPPALARAEALIASSAGRLGVAAIASRCGLSRGRLHQLFRTHRHYSPIYALAEARMARARALLQEGRLSVTAIAMELEFSSAQHFAAAFRRHCGCAPTTWRASS